MNRPRTPGTGNRAFWWLVAVWALVRGAAVYGICCLALASYDAIRADGMAAVWSSDPNLLPGLFLLVLTAAGIGRAAWSLGRSAWHTRGFARQIRGHLTAPPPGLAAAAQRAGIGGSRLVVFGGTLNGPGTLSVQVTKPYQDTVLARVIEQVEQAQARRGTAQRFADKFGAIYTPVMFTLAALTAIAGPAAGLSLREAIYRGLVILVVSCSCALIISVPTAVIAAISRAARDGILIKGGIHLETLAKVRTVAFDKTGTLTAGKPRLTDLIPFGGYPAAQVLAYAAAAEAASEHPLAAAIVAAADDRGLTVTPAADAQAIPGMGMHATVGGHQIAVGRPPGPGELPSPAREQLAALQNDGKTAVLVTIDGHPAGLLGIADQLRPEAAAAVTSLGRLGISRIVILTGDNPATAAAIAQAAGISDPRAGLLPEDKTTAVAGLRGHAGPVAMVGDGINDAPALATADVGIAMGTAGTDVALETADIALMADDLAKLPAAITLAREAASVIRQNIALSLAVIAALDIAAITGHMSLAAGLLLNEGSALLIIANGLRLLRRPARHPAAQPRPSPRPDRPETEPARA